MVELNHCDLGSEVLCLMGLLGGVSGLFHISVSGTWDAVLRPLAFCGSRKLEREDSPSVSCSREELTGTHPRQRGLVTRPFQGREFNQQIRKSADQGTDLSRTFVFTLGQRLISIRFNYLLRLSANPRPPGSAHRIIPLIFHIFVFPLTSGLWLRDRALRPDSSRPYRLHFTRQLYFNYRRSTILFSTEPSDFTVVAVPSSRNLRSALVQDVFKRATAPRHFPHHVTHNPLAVLDRRSLLPRAPHWRSRFDVRINKIQPGRSLLHHASHFARRSRSIL